MAVRLIRESSTRGPNSVVQHPDQRDFTDNAESSPLMSAFSRLDLNLDQDRIGETRNVEIFEDGDFPALRPSYDRQVQTHHIFLRFSQIDNVRMSECSVFEIFITK